MPPLLEFVVTIVGFVAPAWADRRRLRLTTHRANFLDTNARPVGPEHYFVTATNRSRNRDLTITHVWFATTPQIDIVDDALPVRLRPDERWETAVPVDQLPAATRNVAFNLARAQLSSDAVVSSTRNWNVRPVGRVPRGGESRT